MNTCRRVTILATCWLLCCLSTGCVTRGRTIDTSKIDQIQIGTTTRAEIQEMFGVPQSRAVNADGSELWRYHWSRARPSAGSILASVWGSTRVSNRTVVGASLPLPVTRSAPVVNSTALDITFADDVVVDYKWSEGRE